MKKIFILGLFVVLTATACTPKNGNVVSDIGLEKAKTVATDFINNYLMGPGQKVSIASSTEENGLYKIVVNMADGQAVDSFISKDGSTFFPSGMDIAKFKEEKDGTKDKQTATTPEANLSNIAKAEKPKVELFVMSHCPYGTQMEKGILPVLETLGDSIDFELKFCDYSMHGKKELDEELSQYCVQKNSPEKLQDYLSCFLADEAKGDECLASLGINKKQHDACVASTDKQYKITEMFNDKNTWKNGRYPSFPIDGGDNEKYKVSGSPSLVLNGSKIQSSRDSASLLKTICAGFENEPEACKASLSSTAPGPGFGFDATKSGGSAASCGG